MNRAERRAQMKKQPKVKYDPSEETNICIEEDRD
jgi:hypothetical protein